MAQRAIDFAANFWNYVNLVVEPPAAIQDIQRTVITSATSIFQPDLLTHESFYNNELALGHNIVVVAHSQATCTLIRRIRLSRHWVDKTCSI